MPIRLDGIANEQRMEVEVSGPNGANRLFVLTGTAMFNFKGTSRTWNRDSLSFEIEPRLGAHQFRRAVAMAAPASISNVEHAYYAGWAVDKVNADWDDESGLIRVTADLAVRDSDGYMQRMAYQVNVLAKI